MLDGETAFKLYDTYGFPLDLTADICRERDVRVDYAGFDAAMQRQRERARAASKFTVTRRRGVLRPADRVPRLRYAHARRHGGGAVPRGQRRSRKSLPATAAVVVLDRTPFYAESGGQVGDRGELRAASNGSFSVEDTQKIQAEVFGHQGELKAGRLRVGERVTAAVDTRGARRARVRTIRRRI